MSDSTLSLLILAVVVAVFVWNRLPVAIVAMGAALALYATGLIDEEQVVAGFGSDVVVFVACLFVIGEAVDSTGLTSWLGGKLIDRVGTGQRSIVAALMGLAAMLTAIMSFDGAVAALVPMVVVLSMRLGRRPGKLLLPLVYAGSAGSLLVLSASPVNVIVSSAASDAGVGSIGFFEFAIAGIPLVLGTVAICVLFGERLVPDRDPERMPPDLSRYAETIIGSYELVDGVYRLRVTDGSPAVGQLPDALSATGGVTVVGVQRQGGPAPSGPLAVDDVLVASGPAAEVSELALAWSLAVTMRPVVSSGELVGREAGVAELVIAPRSSLIGRTVFPGYLVGNELTVLGVRRRGKERGPQTTDLSEGDQVLVHGAWSSVTGLSENRDVLVVGSPELLRRQVAPLDGRAAKALLVLAGMIVLLSSGLTSPAVAGIAAVVTLVLLRVVSMEQAYRSIAWDTVVLVGGLIPLSVAIQTSGAADRIVEFVLDIVGTDSPRLLMMALFLVTAVLGQFVSNTATTLIMTPVAVTAASAASVSPKPILVMLAVAGGAALLTPIATPPNLMIMGPAGFRFGDYWRLGIVVMAWWFVVAVGFVPLVWQF